MLFAEEELIKSSLGTRVTMEATSAAMRDQFNIFRANQSIMQRHVDVLNANIAKKMDTITGAVKKLKGSVASADEDVKAYVKKMQLQNKNGVQKDFYELEGGRGRIGSTAAAPLTPSSSRVRGVTTGSAAELAAGKQRTPSNAGAGFGHDHRASLSSLNVETANKNYDVSMTSDYNDGYALSRSTSKQQSTNIAGSPPISTKAGRSVSVDVASSTNYTLSDEKKKPRKSVGFMPEGS